jgi:hypothetical protein
VSKGNTDKNTLILADVVRRNVLGFMKFLGTFDELLISVDNDNHLEAHPESRLRWARGVLVPGQGFVHEGLSTCLG